MALAAQGWLEACIWVWIVLGVTSASLYNGSSHSSLFGNPLHMAELPCLRRPYDAAGYALVMQQSALSGTSLHLSNERALCHMAEVHRLPGAHDAAGDSVELRRLLADRHG